MPAPLAAPKMRTSVPSTSMTDAGDLHAGIGGEDGPGEGFGWAGVWPSEAATDGMAARTLAAGKGTPIMPVDDGKTSSKMQLKVSAAATQVWRQASMPASPVAQLALPALTRTTETLPPVAWRWVLPTVTGAATT